MRLFMVCGEPYRIRFLVISHKEWFPALIVHRVSVDVHKFQ